MKMYIKGFVQRRVSLSVIIITAIVSVMCCFGLFKDKLNNICEQLCTYDSSDYSMIYLLNYGSMLDNECIHTDMDIAFYADIQKEKRIVASGIMKQEGVPYNLAYLSPISELNPGEVCFSENVARRYDLFEGDIVFAEVSYSAELIPIRVKGILETEFDYENPNTDNNVGIAFIGYDKLYDDNTICRYILFANESKANSLAIYPQIINRVLNKSANYGTVLKQGFTALIIEILFNVMAIIIAHIVFFSKSYGLLYRCYLKGMKRSLLSILPVLEKVLLCATPVFLTTYLLLIRLPNCSMKKVYLLIPIVTEGVYCLFTLCNDCLKRRKSR